MTSLLSSVNSAPPLLLVGVVYLCTTIILTDSSLLIPLVDLLIPLVDLFIPRTDFRFHLCFSILLGSAEGFSLAERAISSASKAGRWVLLKNVHLAPQWLVQLEKKLHSLTPHANFRLFLTMEINPKVEYFSLCKCSKWNFF